MSDKQGYFIRFCQRVVGFYPQSPFWSRNLNMFDTVFRKYRDGENISQPVKSFIEKYRDVLEKPVFVDDDLNDEWLTFHKDTPVPVPKKSWSTCCPRGVFIAMKDGDTAAVLPLSEVYSSCMEIAESDLRSFNGVDPKCVVVQFFQYLFDMLLEVEPDNVHFKENVMMAEGLVESSPSNNFDMGSVLKSKMDSVLTQIPEAQRESLEKASNALSKGDFNSVMESMGPMLQQFMPLVKSFTDSLGLDPSCAQTSSQPAEVSEPLAIEHQE